MSPNSTLPSKKAGRPRPRLSILMPRKSQPDGIGREKAGTSRQSHRTLGQIARLPIGRSCFHFPACIVENSIHDFQSRQWFGVRVCLEFRKKGSGSCFSSVSSSISIAPAALKALVVSSKPAIALRSKFSEKIFSTEGAASRRPKRKQNKPQKKASFPNFPTP
jgi:hypothetical protein